MKTIVQEHIVDRGLEEEMRTSYLNYAMSVIVGRALPDVRDGLKPVHRRIHYGMHEMGLRPGQAYRKSAKIVGEIMGNYHPHGDAAIYDTLVRMGQDFNLRYPLVDGQGNYGSLDGDPPAAMRYTEARLAPIAGELLADIDKDTVDFTPNYDETQQEPVVLPTRLPNLLVNGASGIAVGYATNIPTHNLTEVVDALLLLLEQPGADLKAMLKVLPGPDFPTGGVIVGRQGIRDAYETGRGSLTVRGRVEIEEEKGRVRLVATEIPYQVNKAKLIEKVADLVQTRRLTGVADVRDESDREGLRVVLDLKRGEDPQAVLRSLYQLTPLETTFGVMLLGLVDNRPMVLTLKRILELFLEHRRQVVVRRSHFELRQAEERLHILDGYHVALGRLDEVIALIRRSRTPHDAKGQLCRVLGLSERQASAILELRLQRLTALERAAIERERQEVAEKIRWLRSLLADARKIDGVIREELREVQATYGDRRRTKIMRADRADDTGEPEEHGPMMVLGTHRGYLARLSLDQWAGSERKKPERPKGYRRQGDPVVHAMALAAGQRVAVVTSKGRIFGVDMERLPLYESSDRGLHIGQLFSLDDAEQPVGLVVQPAEPTEESLTLATARGLVKRLSWSTIGGLQRRGVSIMPVDADDRVVAVVPSTHAETLALFTRGGQVLMFSGDELKPASRDARPLPGIALEANDAVIGLASASGRHWEVITLSERSWCKRTAHAEYRLQHRGAKGLAALRQTDRTGGLVGLVLLTQPTELLVTTTLGRTVWIMSETLPEKPRMSPGESLDLLATDTERMMTVSAADALRVT